MKAREKSQNERDSREARDKTKGRRKRAMAKEQRIVRFHGTVQGVGFRYTAMQTARSYDVTGTVQNLPDGTVECVVEGEAGEIDGFVEALTERMREYVRKVNQQTAPYAGTYRGFGVAR